MGKTKVEWATHSWSPVTGCSHAGSPGCDNCYARRMARRLAGRYGYPEAPHHFDVTLHSDKLNQPLRWKKPKTIFTVSMGDLFHPDVEVDWLAHIWGVMLKAEWHTFLVLTKRPDRMLQWVRDEVVIALPNVWLGVTAENQAAADERREHLRQCPAAVKFVSHEPALGPMDWAGWEFVDQIISGGESGPGARPSHPGWHRATRDFCQANEIAYFMKQWGRWVPNEAGCGGDYHFNSKHICLNMTGESFDGWMESHGKHIAIMAKAGKKHAGRLLDGRTWDEMPENAACS